MADQGESGGKSSAQDPFEMFRRLWAPLGLPIPGMAMPTLDPAEVEKRIADLRSVETWLGMNLNMVKMAIQGLEVQKMALEAMKANSSAASDAANAFASMSRSASSDSATGAAGQAGDLHTNPNPLASPMLWPWAMMQAAPAPEKAAEPKARERKDRKDSK